MGHKRFIDSKVRTWENRCKKMNLIAKKKNGLKWKFYLRWINKKVYDMMNFPQGYK